MRNKMPQVTLQQRYSLPLDLEQPRVILGGVKYHPKDIRSIVWANAKGTYESYLKTDKLIVWTHSNERYEVYQSKCDAETRYWLCEVAFQNKA